MNYFVDALTSSANQPLHGLKNVLHSLGLHLRGPTEVIGGFVFGYAVISLVRGRLIPRKFLDLLGVFVVINLVFHFFKINVLLFTPPGPPNLLLGQLVTFVVFFIVAWGWIYWRIDCAEHEGTAGILTFSDLSRPPEDAGETWSMFDYMYSSMLLIQTMGRSSNISGSTRVGKLLVSIHGFIVIDIVGIGLGRFYQLIESTL